MDFSVIHWFLLDPGGNAANHGRYIQTQDRNYFLFFLFFMVLEVSAFVKVWFIVFLFPTLEPQLFLISRYQDFPHGGC